MKEIFKSYKYRMIPTKDQIVILEKHFGACRFIYNHFLSIRKELYENEKISRNSYADSKDLTILKHTEEFSWLNEIYRHSLKSELFNLDKAYDKFFKKTGGFPKFKKKSDTQSYSIPVPIKVIGKFVKIPKIKSNIRIRIKKEVVGEIRYATISKSSTGKYFISITYKEQYTPYKKTNSTVGIDTGIKNLAILSNGEIYDNIKPIKKYIKKLKYNHRQLSKKVNGSSSRNKQRIKLAKTYEKVTNIRTDYLHKVSTEIIKNHDIICIEDLSVKKMTQNKLLAKSLQDVSLGTFYSFLQYKATKNDKVIVKIDKYFPSSKKCSVCGYIKEDLTLKDREWVCPNCNTKHDRDFNASINIKNEGIKILSGYGE